MDGDHWPVKMQILEPTPTRHTYKTTSGPKDQGLLQEKVLKDYNSQRNKEFAERLCLVGMSEATLRKSEKHQYLNMSQQGWYQ